MNSTDCLEYIWHSFFDCTQDLEAQYEDYSQLLHSVDLALDEAESKLPPTIDLDNVKCPDLVAQLDQTQVRNTMSYR